jgi:hypothetical protein
MGTKSQILALGALAIVSGGARSGPIINRLPLELHANEPPILTVLQQEVLDAVHAIPTGKTTHVQGLDGLFEVPLFKVRQVKLGTAEFTEVVARLDTIRKGYEPDKVTKGFLGSSLLKPYQVVINYPARAMTLQLPKVRVSKNRCTGTAVPFATGQEAWAGEAFTEAETDIGRVILSWDTGAFTSVLRRSLVEVAQPKHTESTLVTTKFVIGGDDFGPQQFEVWELSLPHFDGFVGNDFFATHVVCIDFPGKQLRVSAASRLSRVFPTATVEGRSASKSTGERAAIR